MVQFKLQFLMFLLFAIKQLSNSMAQKSLLALTVYYESKCPDSKSFILKQLEPSMQHLSDYVQLKFVPFGKARSINYGDAGFECQHGPSECLGNIVQDCSLHLLGDRSDKERLEYVACEMYTEAGSQGRFDCVERAMLSSTEVEQCVLQGKGTALQLESEYYTDLVKPKFVPTVTINGIFNQEIQNNSQRDLFGTICSLIPDVPPCAKHYNYLALNHVLYV
ncbi:gamma-interferon-inducible lysosomal thiol reductase [Bicyclus anynana]|uniref:Gamma-interferon-inducible lysosomal thiol reductase n=1 Tax=Bicyclus anynana TaxID=110368 RepID=A0ABM3LSZ0_BICAN|nr:gamma-interferon-inducible lysosomal thiol reductase [Bicyclus anynana]